MATQERPLRLLSLDGGGVRGLSSLYILQGIFERIQQQEQKCRERTGEHYDELRPCDYFDMIAGTSTGGLIAIMLGVLRMDIESSIHAYLNMAKQIFPKEGKLARISIWKTKKALTGEYRFKAEPFETFIKTLIKEQLESEAPESEMMCARHDQGCKVFVCANTAEPLIACRLRSYSSTWTSADNVAVWEACRATSAAPTIFPPIFIGDPPVPYVDGGLGYNNPTRHLLDEVKHVWPSRTVGCILSVGTGVPALKDVGKSIELLETLKDIATDTERVASEMQKEMDHQQSAQPFCFRFNVQNGLQYVKLEEWEMMARIKIVTRSYLQQEWQRVDLCASQLQAPTNSIQLVPQVEQRKGSSSIPFPRDDSFIGRQVILSELDIAFEKRKARPWASLCGLGGIGKSQIAIEYSYRLREQSPQMSAFWVSVSNTVRFEQSYAEIASVIGIGMVGKSNHDRLQAVKNWLADEKNGRWLMVLDNVDDLAVLLGPKSDKEATTPHVRKPYIQYVPQVPHGIVLITSRDTFVGSKLLDHRYKPIEVLPMDKEDSLALLMTRLAEAPKEIAVELVTELGHVPLAVTQAGAYIQELSPIMSAQSYLEQFRRTTDVRLALLNEDNGDLRRDVGGSSSVITTLEISFNRLQEKNEIAYSILSVMGCLNRQGIPRCVLQGDQELHKFLMDVKPLLSLSLIKVEIDDDFFEMHRLVHLALRYRLRKNDAEHFWKKVAIMKVVCQFPKNQKSVKERSHLCEALLPHAAELSSHKIDDEEYESLRAALKRQTDYYIGHKHGVNVAAKKKLVEILQAQQSILGDESADTVDSRLKLFDPSSDHSEEFVAERVLLHESMLNRETELPGPENMRTTVAKETLACSYILQKRYGEARDLLMRAVDVKSLLISPIALDTLKTKQALAECEAADGNLAASEKIYHEILRAYTSDDGDVSLDTIYIKGKLASLYMRQEKYPEAKVLITSNFNPVIKVLGRDHPLSLQTLVSLAILHMKEGDIQQAARMITEYMDTLGERSSPISATDINLDHLYVIQAFFREVSPLLGRYTPSELEPTPKQMEAIQRRMKEREASGHGRGRKREVNST